MSTVKEGIAVNSLAIGVNATLLMNYAAGHLTGPLWVIQAAGVVLHLILLRYWWRQ